LVKWSADWQTLFNVDKCKIIYVGYSNCHADYYMCGNKSETVDEEKDLRVIVSKDLKWDKQCGQAVKKANRMLGIIKKILLIDLRKLLCLCIKVL